MDWKAAFTFSFPSLVSAILALIAIGMSWKRRHIPGLMPFMLAVLGIAVWALGDFPLHLSTTLQSKVFWYRMRTMGVLVAPLSWFVFAVQYTGHQSWLKRSRVVLLAIVPLISMSLLWLGGGSQVFTGFIVESLGREQVLIVEGVGPWFWVNILYSIVLLFISSLLLVLRYLRSSIRQQQHTRLVLSYILMPGVGGGLYLLDVLPIASPLPCSLYAFILFIISWGLLRYRLMGVAPVAHRTLIENMSDGVIVLDNQERIVSINLAAQRIFSRDPGQSIGLPLLQVLPELAQVIDLSGSKNALQTGFTADVSGEKTFYNLNIIPLKEADGAYLGWLVTLYDISDLKKAEESLQWTTVREQALREIDQGIFSGQSLEIIAVSTLTKMQGVFPFQAASIVLLDHELDEAQILALWAGEELVPQEARLSLSGIQISPGVLEGKLFQQEDTNAPHNYEWFLNGAPVSAYLSLPLVAWGHVIGLLNLGLDVSGEFTPQQVEIASEIADSLAVGIQNTRLYQQQRQRAEELTALREMGTAILSELDLQVLLETIVERALVLLKASAGEIALYDEERGDLVVQVSVGFGQDFRGTRIAMGEGGMGRAAMAREPVLITNYQEWEGQIKSYAKIAPSALLAAPLIAGDRVIGAFGVGDDTPSRLFSPEDVRLLTLFGLQAAIAIENAMLYKAARQRAAEAETLRQVGAAVAATIHLEDTINTILEQVKLVVPFDTASVQLMKDGEMEVVGVRGFPDSHAVLGIRFPVSGDEPGTVVFSERRPRIIGNMPDAYPLFGNMMHYRVISWLGIPLIIQDQVIGMLALESSLANYFTREHERLVSAFADQVSIAIENARLFGEVRRLAVTDPLTGLFNRRHFFELAQSEYERSARYQHPFSLVMLDIDLFKRVNDTYGHLAGDQVLVVVARRCQESLREVDIIGRYGGEEMVVLLPETSTKKARSVAERLRQAVGSVPIKTDQGLVSVTVSVGIAGMEQHTSLPLEALLDRADHAMYASKESGRNRVTAWTD